MGYSLDHHSRFAALAGWKHPLIANYSSIYSLWLPQWREKYPFYVPCIWVPKSGKILQIFWSSILEKNRFTNWTSKNLAKITQKWFLTLAKIQTHQGSLQSQVWSKFGQNWNWSIWADLDDTKENQGNLGESLSVQLVNGPITNLHSIAHLTAWKIWL